MQKEFEPNFTYIDTDSAMLGLAAELSGCSFAGVDIEGSSLHSFGDNVSLIQIGIEKGVFIVDPLCKADIKPLLESLANVNLIFHGGDYDLRMLLHDFNFTPKQAVYDTMIGAELLGAESIGLAALLEMFLNVNISKESQKSDWTRRPLSDTQLKYACYDVLFLKELFDKIKAELCGLERFCWWTESCQRLVAHSRESKSNSNNGDLWRIRGSRDFNAAQLCYLKHLWLWRNSVAKQANKPVFKISSNDFLLNMAQWLEANPEGEPRSFPQLNKYCKGKNLASLLEMISQAKRLPKEQYPQPIERSKKYFQYPDKQLVEQLREAVMLKAEGLKIKPQLIVSRAKIEAIARNLPTDLATLIAVGDLMNWQAALVGEELLAILTEVNGR